MKITALAALTAVVALILALPALAATPVYTGVVGPGFTITLAKKPTKAGSAVSANSQRQASSAAHRLVAPAARATATVPIAQNPSRATSQRPRRAGHRGETNAERPSCPATERPSVPRRFAPGLGEAR